jgi:hypothetical protein
MNMMLFPLSLVAPPLFDRIEVERQRRALVVILPVVCDETTRALSSTV